MNLVCMICLIHVSCAVQLQCDRTQVTAHVGGEFVVSCNYNSYNFLYSKKYWCRGSSRSSCEIVADSETKKTQRSMVFDFGHRGLYVKVTGLRFEDSGTYWVGINKVYADVMTAVQVVVTEVPVSKPTLRPLSALVDRPTCWGKAVTVRCDSDRGTNVMYVWYQQTHPEAVLVSASPDLRLHCGMAQTDASFYCVAKNNMGQQQSNPVYVQVLMPAENNCIYAVKIQGQLLYDCADRLTTTAVTTTSLPTTTTFFSTTVSDSTPPASLVDQNQTHHSGNFSRPLSSIPPWYRVIRLSLFGFMLIVLLLVVRGTKTRHRRSRARRRTRKTYCP